MQRTGLRFAGLRFVFAIVLAAGGATLHAAEPDAAAMARESFELADVDGDACVSWEEFRNRSLRIFRDLDLNGDGIIEGDEHPPAFDAQGQSVEPGAATVAGFQAVLKRHFTAADSDDSGCVTMAEWTHDPSKDDS